MHGTVRRSSCQGSGDMGTVSGIRLWNARWMRRYQRWIRQETTADEEIRGYAIMGSLCKMGVGDGRLESTNNSDATAHKKRTFRKFSYRGVDLEQLLDISSEEFMKMVTCRARRKFKRGLKRKPMGLIKKLRIAKQQAPENEKPAAVKTHLRSMIIVPEMIGSIIGIYNGKTFNQVEIKPEMIGHYLGEFSMTYKPVKHGRPGMGATHSSRFIPLK
ncbi:ribosomal protein S15 [Coemansia sp. IMI 203386]|nr:ribosomal protein S15 [Coemansia sp. IMI 203386]